MLERTCNAVKDGRVLCANSISSSWFLKHFGLKLSQDTRRNRLCVVFICMLLFSSISDCHLPEDKNQDLSSHTCSLHSGCSTWTSRTSDAPGVAKPAGADRRASLPRRLPVTLNHTILSLRHCCFSREVKIHCLESEKTFQRNRDQAKAALLAM